MVFFGFIHIFIVFVSATVIYSMIFLIGYLTISAYWTKILYRFPLFFLIWWIIKNHCYHYQVGKVSCDYFSIPTKRWLFSYQEVFVDFSKYMVHVIISSSHELYTVTLYHTTPTIYTNLEKTLSILQKVTPKKQVFPLWRTNKRN